MVKEFGFSMAFGVVIIVSGWFGISPRVIVFVSIIITTLRGKELTQESWFLC